MLKKLNKMGNSKGIIIPKGVIEYWDCEFINMTFVDGKLILEPVKEDKKCS